MATCTDLTQIDPTIVYVNVVYRYHTFSYTGTCTKNQTPVGKDKTLTYTKNSNSHFSPTLSSISKITGWCFNNIQSERTASKSDPRTMETWEMGLSSRGCSPRGWVMGVVSTPCRVSVQQQSIGVNWNFNLQKPLHLCHSKCGAI